MLVKDRSCRLVVLKVEICHPRTNEFSSDFLDVHSAAFFIFLVHSSIIIGFVHDSASLELYINNMIFSPTVFVGLVLLSRSFYAASAPNQHPFLPHSWMRQRLRDPPITNAFVNTAPLRSFESAKLVAQLQVQQNNAFLREESDSSADGGHRGMVVWIILMGLGAYRHTYPRARKNLKMIPVPITLMLASNEQCRKQPAFRKVHGCFSGVGNRISRGVGDVDPFGGSMSAYRRTLSDKRSERHKRREME